MTDNCPMCYRSNCPGYMSKDCQNEVFKMNPDFGARVLEKVISHGNDLDRPRKIREFIENETVEKLQKVYDDGGVRGICKILRKKTGVIIEPESIWIYLKTAGLKFRVRGSKRKKLTK